VTCLLFLLRITCNDSSYLQKMLAAAGILVTVCVFAICIYILLVLQV